MAERILPDAALRPTASPVDRYVQPVFQQAPQDNNWLKAASALSSLNPSLNQYLQNRNAENAAEAEAEGAQAEMDINAQYEFDRSREAWGTLVKDVRKQDPVQADRLAAANPHFRRGVVKARMNRLGMALNDHLMNLWRENPEVNGQALHDIDDPTVVQQWMLEQTKAYTDRFGVGDMDPILQNEVYNKRVTAAHDGLLSRHTEFRLNRYQTEYLEEISGNAGMLMMGGGTSNSDVDTFMEKMGMSESGGNYGVVNDLGYTGKFQFGEGRLADYNRANGTNISLSELNNTTEGRRKQYAVMRWHVADIDAEIDRQGFMDKGYSRDGLRAVAHLGGKGGMVKFVTSGGAYDPDDGYTNKQGKKVKGTKLSDYYRKFSGPSAELQRLRDTAIADGMDPTKTNKQIVDAVILSAREAGNPEALDVLDQLDTGNGPLGNIGWVRAAKQQAEAQILDQQWKMQERELVIEQREQEAQRAGMTNEATRAVLSDPYADITGIQQQALDNGYTDLATSLGSLQETLINRDQKVHTDDALVTDLRIRISNGSIQSGEFYDTLTEAVNAGLIDASAATGLLDDFDRQESYTDLLGDRQVSSNLGDFNRVVSERFAITDPSFGTRISGTEKGVEAEVWMRGMLMDFIAENPEATTTEVREYSEGLLDKALKSPIWQPTADEKAAENPRPYGQVTSTAETFEAIDPTNIRPEDYASINQLAVSMGITAQELMTRLGLIEQQGQ